MKLRDVIAEDQSQKIEIARAREISTRRLQWARAAFFPVILGIFNTEYVTKVLGGLKGVAYRMRGNEGGFGEDLHKIMGRTSLKEHIIYWKSSCSIMFSLNPKRESAVYFNIGLTISTTSGDYLRDFRGYDKDIKLYVSARAYDGSEELTYVPLPGPDVDFTTWLTKVTQVSVRHILETDWDEMRRKGLYFQQVFRENGIEL